MPAQDPSPPADAHQQRFAGVPVPVPEYAGDDGGPDPALAAALAALAQGRGTRHAVTAALVGARLLAPVVAVLDTAEPSDDEGGLTREKDSHMATVTLVNPDGRRGLLAFTCTAALAAWRADARPVAAPASRCAEAALEEGAHALLLDVAGPVPFPVEGPALAALAEGAAYHPGRDPVVAAAVRAAVDRVRVGVGISVDDGREHGCDLLVRVALPAPEAERVAALLAADATLQVVCPDGIAVAAG